MNTPLYVKKAHIINLLEQSEKVIFHRIFGKLTIVIVKLPNGFTLVGQSGCVDPENYDEKIGEECAMEEITHQLWAFEGYTLQQNVHESKM